jgi:hypothetical protein
MYFWDIEKIKPFNGCIYRLGTKGIKVNFVFSRVWCNMWHLHLGGTLIVKFETYVWLMTILKGY